MRENGNEQPIKFKKCLINLKLVIVVTKWAFTVYRRKEVTVEVCTCTCMYKCRHWWSLSLCIIDFGHARWMVNSNICKYSRLSITLTFKGNWKRFELLGVWVIGRSNYREFELLGVQNHWPEIRKKQCYMLMFKFYSCGVHFNQI